MNCNTETSESTSQGGTKQSAKLEWVAPKASSLHTNETEGAIFVDGAEADGGGLTS